jgi:membrane-associated PAP2 superfamily phosphatase
MVSTFGLASAGAWIASFFGTGWRAYRRPALFAFVALALGIAAGTTFSFGQEARGARFLSHDLWSAFVVWFTQLGLYAGAFRARLWPPPAI